jgi:hypothetical protein
MQRKRDDARERAAHVPEAKRAREDAHAGEMPMVSDHDSIIPWLRQLGFRADEARRAAAQCEGLGNAPLEERVKFAIKQLAPRSAHRAGPVA